MIEDFSKKFQKAKFHFENYRQKMIVRAWSLAKRLDPKTIKQEKRKPKNR